MSLLICPNCKAGMKAITRLDVEIDVCPECQGVWLDHGELDQLLAAVRSGAPAGMGQRSEPHGYTQPSSPPWGAQRPSRDDDDDDHHGRHDDDDDRRRREPGHDDGQGQEGRRRGWRGLLDMFE